MIVLDEWWVLNDVAEGPTFQTSRGSSFIDVTLSSVRMNVKWSLYDWTSSAHRLILMDVGADRCVGSDRRDVDVKEDKVIMYNLKKADWGEYVERLKWLVEGMPEVLLTGKDKVMLLERKLRFVLLEAAKGAIPRKAVWVYVR